MNLETLLASFVMGIGFGAGALAFEQALHFIRERSK